MSDPITAPGHTEYQPAYRQSGTRSKGSVRYVVLHDTEGGTAESVAAYFHSTNAEGSAHLVCDGNYTYRCLPDGVIPWAAANKNQDGFHIEMCGYASWSRLTWLRHWKELRRVAYKTAAACYRFHIPVVWVGPEGLAKRQPGITTHRAVSAWSAAHHLPGDHSHTDPGPNFPAWFFMNLVRYYTKQLHNHPQ